MTISKSLQDRLGGSFKKNLRRESHWRSFLVYSPVVDQTLLKKPFHEVFRHRIVTTQDQTSYYPILYENSFWMRQDHLTSLHDMKEGSRLQVKLLFYPISLTKFTVMEQFVRGLESQKSWGLSEYEVDEIKRIFAETNPYFFVPDSMCEYTPYALRISRLQERHFILAKTRRFYGFIRSYRLLEYLFSIYYYPLPLGQQNKLDYPCLLYFRDSPRVLETMQAHYHQKTPEKFFRITPQLKLQYRDTKTNQFDDQAMRYLSYVLSPFLLIYATYCLVHEKFKGWYSFFLHTQVSFIYAAGFVFMTPQLFINYKLKSVAHLPWKTFIYKALNTVVDDFFAFIVQMPLLHRLACFRDDVVFLVLLYQWWTYPVDYSRTNEFGQRSEKGSLTLKPKLE